MISGGLTSDQAVNREERTALFFCAAGALIQKRLNVARVTTRKLYKILANALWDWHWLPLLNKKFLWHGIGDLVWVPHLFGGIAQVHPSIHHNNFHLTEGLFATWSQLAEIAMYEEYGLLDVATEEGSVSLQFAPVIEFELLAKSPVETPEWFHWKELIELYVSLDDETLDAAASCRNDIAALLCIAAQMIRWRKHVVEAFSKIEEGPVDNPAINIHLTRARGCASQFEAKIGYLAERETYLGRVAAAAVGTPFAGFAPAVNLLSKHENAGHHLDQLVKHAEVFYALHRVARLVQKRLLGEPYEADRLEKAMEQLRQFLWARASEVKKLCDAVSWHALFCAGPEPELARSGLALIRAVFNKLQLLGREMPNQRDFYHLVMSNVQYPLPRDHFQSGC